MIDNISKKTGYSKQEIYKILNTIPSIISENAINTTNKSEIKLFPGLSVIFKYKSKDELNNKYSNILKCKRDKLFVSARISDGYRKKINKEYFDKMP